MDALAQLIELLYFVFTLLILARVLMSWVQIDPYGPLGSVAEVIFTLTEPVLAPVRNLMPPMSGMDFSPIIVLIGIQILGQMLVAILRGA